MSSFLNNWVSFFERTYPQIKASVLTRVTTSNPEMTDHNASNPFIIMLDIVAGVSEMMGYYIDRNAMESYVSTAFKRASLLRHAESYDYQVAARNPEAVDLTILVKDAQGDSTTLASDVTIPTGTIFLSDSNYEFTNITDHVISAGESSYTLPVQQVSIISNSTIGTTDGSQGQDIELGAKYVHNSLSVTINAQAYTLVETFAHSGPTDFHCKVVVKTDGKAYVRFGDGLKGALPPTGIDIIATYRETEGADARAIPSAINNAANMPVVSGIQWDIYNINSSSGGTDFESDEDIRKNLPYHSRTLEVAARASDFWQIAEQVSGVSKAEIDESNIRPIVVYVVPTGGGIASSSLITSVANTLELSRLVGTTISVTSAGESVLVMNMNVTPKIGYDPTDTRNDVLAALLDWGSDDNQYINKPVRVSDLIALVDNLQRVDFMDINYIYLKPYPRPISHINPLDWTVEILPGATTKIEWRLEYVSTGDQVRIFKDGNYVTQVNVGNEYVDADSVLKFTINAASYSNGNTWTFTSYGYNTDVVLDDFSIVTTEEASTSISMSSANLVNARRG